MEWEKLNKLSLEELESKALELYGKANYRIARLGSRRGESPAYEKLKTYIGSPYLQEQEYLKFKIPKTENVRQKMNQLIQSIGVAEKFLSAETSTAKGIERVKRNRRKWVRKNFDGFNTNEEADDFLKFLGSSEIQEQKQIFDSNIIVEAKNDVVSKPRYNSGGELVIVKTKDYKEYQKDSGPVEIRHPLIVARYFPQNRTPSEEYDLHD